MNDLTVTTSRAQPQRLPTPAELARSALAVEDRLLAPTDELIRVRRPFHEIRRKLVEGGDPSVEQARRMFDQLPGDDVQTDAVEQIAEALAKPADAIVARVLVSLLIESAPTPRSGHSAAAVEALVHDLVDLGVPPIVVALGCRDLRRELKFPPSIAEVLVACEAATETLKGKVNSASFYRDEVDRTFRRLMRIVTPPPPRDVPLTPPDVRDNEIPF